MNEQSEQLLFNMDPGLNLIYDGSRNTLLGNNRVYDYPCGGVIAEYMRLKPAQIKQMIMKCNGLSEDVTVDNVMRFFTDFQGIAQEELEPVQEIMVMIEFENYFSDWFKAVQENRTDELSPEVRAKILAYMFGEEDSEPEQDRNILCTLFGHNYETTISYTVTHNVYTTSPKCVKKTYTTYTCSRCGHVETELTKTERISTCHG